MSNDIPAHIGFIVDGNRRWAAAHNRKPWEGHQEGYEALKVVLLDVLSRGVPYASAYVFSTENWKRDDKEVNKLMTLLLKVLSDNIPIFIEKNIRLRVLGSKDKLSKKVVQAINEAERSTAHLNGGQLALCLNYGGQLEIVDAYRSIIKKKIPVENITKELIGEHLYAPDIPACDVIVRTGGEQRLSNFMLWRSAYSELIFLDKYWPDMTKKDVTAILNEYQRRSRRFGG